jgi:plasmid stability protein
MTALLERPPPRRRGVTSGIIAPMAMTLRLTDSETDALRKRAAFESKSMQDVAREAIREYIEEHSRRDLIDSVLDEELPRFAEALDRLAR